MSVWKRNVEYAECPIDLYGFHYYYFFSILDLAHFQQSLTISQTESCKKIYLHTYLPEKQTFIEPASSLWYE